MSCRMLGAIALRKAPEGCGAVSEDEASRHLTPLW